MTIFSLNPPEFPSEWASAWGQDSYGYWQAISLNKVQQVMRWIPPGSFQMGSPLSEPERRDDENLHKVTLTQGYWLADTACTQSLWLAVMGDNPSEFADNPENPVNLISWSDCQRFFTATEALLPKGFNLRLPTEAEWEYACRANTQTVFSWGNNLTTEQANFNGNFSYNNGKKGEDRKSVVEVLNFLPNPWGLYQMHGNVWEICSDYSGQYCTEDGEDPQGASKGQYHVLRGGSWSVNGRDLRSASRLARGSDYRYGDTGFRLAGG